MYTTLMTVSTIVIVFTVMICSCTIVIVVSFNYRPALITITCRQLYSNNYMDSYVYEKHARISAAWETHITITPACMHAGIAHCWLYSYAQSCSCVYSYQTPIRVCDNAMSHTHMGQCMHMGQNNHNISNIKHHI